MNNNSKTKTKIVIVEDEEDIREILEYTLTREGFEVSSAADGASGLELIRSEQPALVLLDLMLPDVDGLELCRQLKGDSATGSIAIIMVSAKGGEADIVLGLGLGADDYVPKPFSARELVARTRSVLRRTGRTQPADRTAGPLTVGPLRVDLEKHRVHVHGEEVEFTLTELKILHMLASHPGRIFSRAQIVTSSRGDLFAAEERTVDAHVRTIRKKLGDARNMIQTVRAVGYRFEEQTDPGLENK